MQDKDKMGIKDDKQGKIKDDEVGKLGGDKPLVTPKPDLGKKDDVHSDKP